MTAIAPGVAKAPPQVEPGTGRIRVSRGSGGSVVTGAFAASPLRLLTPVNHGQAAWIFASSFGGGMVDGDRTSLDVEVDAGAAAYLSTQASTKIYPSPSGTSAVLRATVGDGGLLVIAPDPVVCFAGARYTQRQEVDLAPGGTLVMLDWLSSGRRAFGERWAFEEYDARLVVRRAGRLLLYESLALRSRDGDIGERLGRFNVLAVLALSGPLIGREVARICDEAAARPLERRAETLIAAAPLGTDACVVRIAAVSTERAGDAVRTFLSAVPGMLGDNPWARKW